MLLLFFFHLFLRYSTKGDWDIPVCLVFQMHVYNGRGDEFFMHLSVDRVHPVSMLCGLLLWLSVQGEELRKVDDRLVSEAQSVHQSLELWLCDGPVQDGHQCPVECFSVTLSCANLRIDYLE